MGKHKIFSLFKAKKLEGIIFRGVIFSALSTLKWIDYIQENKGMDLLGGIIFGILALFTIDDYWEYKKENKVLNEK